MRRGKENVIILKNIKYTKRKTKNLNTQLNVLKLKNETALNDKFKKNVK